MAQPLVKKELLLLVVLVVQLFSVKSCGELSFHTVNRFGIDLDHLSEFNERKSLFLYTTSKPKNV